MRSTGRCSYNLRITRRRADSCGLHRSTSQVIRRSGSGVCGVSSASARGRHRATAPRSGAAMDAGAAGARGRARERRDRRVGVNSEEFDSPVGERARGGDGGGGGRRRAFDTHDDGRRRRRRRSRAARVPSFVTTLRSGVATSASGRWSRANGSRTRAESLSGRSVGRSGRTTGVNRRRRDDDATLPVMILPQVHLRKPCYDFYFL